MFNGNVMKIPHNNINITEEMNKSGCWKSLDPTHNNESPQQQEST